MAAPNNTDMPGLLNKAANSVVAILVEPADESKSLCFSGTVLVCRQHLLYMLTVSDIMDYVDNAVIKLRMINDDFITLQRNNFHMDGDHGIVGIGVTNPPRGAFEHLVEIGFNEQGIQDQQKVYTYSISRKHGVHMLTPGVVVYGVVTIWFRFAASHLGGVDSFMSQFSKSDYQNWPFALISGTLEKRNRGGGGATGAHDLLVDGGSVVLVDKLESGNRMRQGR